MNTRRGHQRHDHHHGVPGHAANVLETERRDQKSAGVDACHANQQAWQ